MCFFVLCSVFFYLDSKKKERQMSCSIVEKGTPLYTELRNRLVEAMDDYGIESSDPNQDPRWTHNVLANDMVFFPCGRMASAADLASNEHTHDEDEVELCNEIATESSRLLHGTYTDRGDEGDHAWKPFSCPITCEEKELYSPLFGELISEKELIYMFGGSILPGQRFKALSMEDEIQRYESERRDGDENAGSRAAEPFYIMLQYLRNHQDEEVRKTATYFRSIEDGRGPVRPCVFPHFFIARTSKGSIAGVSGITVWT